MSLNLKNSLTTKRKVFFLYYPEYRNGGGTVMRGYQLSQIAKKVLNAHYKVDFLPYSKKVSNSIIFLPKMTIYSLSTEEMKRIKQRDNKLLFDPNDGIIPAEKLKYADAVVACSLHAYNAYKEMYPEKKIYFINHHVDPRVQPPLYSHKEYKVGYFGEIDNTIQYPSLTQYVDFIRVDTTSQDDTSWIDYIPGYSMHYAVRRRQDYDGYKPATKVFTAARCKSNIIIQDSEEEAMEWLTDDYPYILQGEVTEASILNMLSYAKKTFETDIWEEGLSIMETINQRVSDEEIGKQVAYVVKEIERAS